MNATTKVMKVKYFHNTWNTCTCSYYMILKLAVNIYKGKGPGIKLQI